MTSLVGQTLGRYEIVDLIGAGGMGEVYRARDTELGRAVAVKVVQDDVGCSQRALDRFEREARTVAQLSHPNILEIHDFGRDDGVVFAVTELLDGQDLRHRTRGGPLPLAKAIEIGIAVANGLAAAHGKGIVHRDIKPENVFVTTTGHVKILDFGIAGLRDAPAAGDADAGARTATLTAAGSVVGTVGYMSPEQARGEPADPRSDIFSLGCLLYELLAGRRAFQAETPHETMRAILNRDPAPIADSRPGVPPSLEVVVRRCLEKEPTERFESARDVAFALQAISISELTPPATAVERLRRRRPWRAGAGAAAAVLLAIAVAAWWWLAHQPPPPLPEALHLAVVDFAASGGDAALTGLADGLTETVASSLTELERQSRGTTWVVPRRHRPPDGPWTVEAAAEGHGATLGVEGTVSAEGERLRLELRLRQPGAPAPLRTAVIDEPMDNLIAFQVAPLERIASMLGVELAREDLDELRSRSTTVVPALQSYLTADGLLRRATSPDTLLAARGGMERASDLDPTFADARAGLLEACAGLEAAGNPAAADAACRDAVPSPGQVRSPELAAAAAAVARARGDDQAAVEWMQRAVRLRPDDAELQLRLGRDLQAAGDLDAAEMAFHRAIDLRPDYWEGHYYLGYVEYVRGRFEATANAWRNAARCAPERASLFANLGAVLYALDRQAEALPMFERAVELTGGGNAQVLSNLGTLYFEDARYAEAASAFERAVAVDPDDYRKWGYLAWSLAAGLEPSRAAEPFRHAAELAETELATMPDDAALLARLAGYHGMLGNLERGLELVERAVALAPEDPSVIATVGETLEDLGERDRALEWIGRALDAGIARSRFESHPSLRDLVADPRYRNLIEDREPAAAAAPR